MIEVNFREARRNLAQLLDRVAAGEEILVLRRDKPAARLVAPDKPIKRLPSLSDFRAELGFPGTPAVDLVHKERARC